MNTRATRVVEPGDAVVLVSGASGFVGTHVVAALLARGHRVRGTVRDRGAGVKTSHLEALDGARERLELVEANLLEEGSFDEAVRGCRAVVHTAAVARLTSKNPERDIVAPSVRGVENVLSAIRRVGGVDVFVQTSSVAAVTGRPEPSYVYSEEDWNETATVERDPYGLAKTSAERLVWELATTANAPRCVALNPAAVFGPVLAKAHARSSPTMIRDFLRGSYPAVPKFHFGVVDARDVGHAHALAVERPVDGRFILSAGSRWMVELATTLQRDYPHRRLPKHQLPNPIMYLASLFDKRLDRHALHNLLGRTITLNAGRSREVLGLRYRPIEESLHDTAESLIHLGLA